MNNHYLPQFYLKQWARPDGKVVYYRLAPNGKFCESLVTPRGTGFEPELYTTPPGTPWERHDPNTIENGLMSPIDDLAARVLAKLVNGATKIEHSERTAWSIFLNALVHRHRDAILDRDAFAPELAERVTSELLAKYSDDIRARERFLDVLRGIDTLGLAKTSHRTLMVRAINDPSAIDAIKMLTWTVLPAHQPIFITTDRPLLVNLGRGGPLGLMTMALSPTRLFVGYPAEWDPADGSVLGLLENVATAHNLVLLSQQPCRYVYSPRPLRDDWVIGAKAIRLRTAVETALRRWSDEPG